MDIGAEPSQALTDLRRAEVGFSCFSWTMSVSIWKGS
jgi:hypothetical protein